MISKEELLQLLKSTETYRIEKTVSTGNMDKFCEPVFFFSLGEVRRPVSLLSILYRFECPLPF